MKVIEFLEEFGLLVKGVSETIENEQTKKQDNF